MPNSTAKIQTREALATHCETLRAEGKKIVFTNGCYDILHSGHVELLQAARSFGDFLILGLNSDASVQRLKGPTRPINPQDARAFVLSALEAVDAVCIFEEDTPVETIAALRPSIHVKGGDYQPNDLPEAKTVRESGGEIRIVPLREGFSTTGTLQKLQGQANGGDVDFRCSVIIPARYGSTRFPGKPLAHLGGKTVIEHVVAAALTTAAERPVFVATDDERIAATIRGAFAAEDAQPVMTSEACATGTDRLAEVVRARFADEAGNPAIRRVIVNVQGDEPFINAAHVDALITAMRADAALPMATLATPITDEAQIDDPNVVKTVLDENGNALYFSRCSIPFVRDAGQNGQALTKLRHLGVYAYSAEWLLEMAELKPTVLEETEKLEQLRALENGCRIRVAVIEDVVNIAIDTPADLEAAITYLQTK